MFPEFYQSFFFGYIFTWLMWALNALRKLVSTICIITYNLGRCWMAQSLVSFLSYISAVIKLHSSSQSVALQLSALQLGHMRLILHRSTSKNVFKTNLSHLLKKPLLSLNLNHKCSQKNSYIPLNLDKIT